MNLDFTKPLATLLMATLIVAATTPAVVAESGQDDPDQRITRVHEIVLDCDDTSGEECERQVRIETLDDESKVLSLGDHQMVWLRHGGHGSHHSFATHSTDRGGFLGVQLTDLTSDLRVHFGVSEEAGVMVAKVVEDSPAFRAGLAPGDIITRVGEESVSSSRQLSRAIRSREEGQMVDLEVWRDGVSETVTATLDESGPGPFQRSVVIDCGDEDADCDVHRMLSHHHPLAVDCPDGEECEVQIQCEDGECSCSLNGTSIDCEELHSQSDLDN